MPRKEQLSKLRIGECFSFESRDDVVPVMVSSIVKPADAFRVEAISDDTVHAISASGIKRTLSSSSNAIRIPRGGFERLRSLHKQALERESPP